MPASVAFAVAALAAGAMGFAIQRGATCTVAAVDELVRTHRATRLASLVEASVWVAGGLVIAQALHLLPTMPRGYPAAVPTVLGGALLGFGAYVNRACVFGAVARLGSGEWAYAITPVGFYAGCLTAVTLVHAAPAKLSHGSPILAASPWLAAAFAAFFVWRLLAVSRRALTEARIDGPRSVVRLWSPHTATIVIGVTFFVTLLLAGAWAYTDVLAELARGMAADLAARTLLLVALFAGALVGGVSAGRFRSARVSVAQLARCFAGGALMGCGSLLIPGGNDGLILVGMPLLWPYAWIAFATMCATIGGAMLLQGAAMSLVAQRNAP